MPPASHWATSGASTPQLALKCKSVARHFLSTFSSYSKVGHPRSHHSTHPCTGPTLGSPTPAESLGPWSPCPH